MAHIKYISPAGWDWDRPVAVPMKWSSRGLVGTDRQEFIKTAGHAFDHLFDRIKIAADEIPVHLIALGASEFYGPNRNGDGFKMAACKANHDTFVKFARYFNNHKNKPEKGHPHFGIIKASAWNDAMKRVELILALNAEKSACVRNGGFVDEKALEKLASDQDLPVSMACRVPFDVCSWCGNKAATRKQYCTPEKCAAGGCKDNLARLIKVAGDMHHLHVDNPFPVWFDISRVFRPADRIAWGAKADWLTKAAADNGLFELAAAIKMAEDDSAPLEVILYQDGVPSTWTIKMAAQAKLAYGLAKLEEHNLGGPEQYRAFTAAIQRPFPVEVLGEPGTTKCAEGLGALADRKIILSLRDFARLAGKEESYEKAAQHVPGVYGRMIEDGTLDRRIEQNKFQLSEKLAASAQRAAANLNAEEHSLEKEAVCHRTELAAIRGNALPDPKTVFEKTAEDVDGENLARDYAIYKIAALQRIASFDLNFPLTVRYALRQNYVS